jgi:branched-chain amino acid transport system permease protein
VLSPLAETIFQFMLRDALLGLSIYLTLYAGMLSLANAGFMAIGAYTSVILMRQLNLPLGVDLLLSMALCGLIAVPIGLPVLRLKDIYLAIATIGFGEVVRILIINFDNIVGTLTGRSVALTQGAAGITGIPKLIETWQLLLFLVLTSYFIFRLHRSRFGRAMSAVRQDEHAAANLGINVVYTRVMVFALSAMLAGAAGVFDAYLARAIRPNDYGFSQAVNILAYAVLGGISTWVGPIVGGMGLRLLPEVLRFSQQFRGVLTGAVLLVVIIYLPGGVVNPAWAWLRRHLRKGPAPGAG